MPASVSRGDLASRMSEAWIAFSRTGVPDHPGNPPWPAYTLAQRATMIFDRDVSCVEMDPRSAEREAWQRSGVPTGMVM
jgi:para-nitrobenzyl esterase